jgi:hypothetical protein
MTRFKELRRIEDAIAHKNEPELRWALAQCELRKKFARKNAPMSRLYRLEKRIREALGDGDS